MSDIVRFALVSKEPTYTPYGYVITDDGVIYSLVKQSCHGVVLAFIFPELAQANGYEVPNKDPDVFHYQSFELDHSRETTAVRISLSLIASEMNISKGETPLTPEQVNALRKVFKVQGLKGKDIIQSDLRETNVQDFLQENT